MRAFSRSLQRGLALLIGLVLAVAPAGLPSGWLPSPLQASGAAPAAPAAPSPASELDQRARQAFGAGDGALAARLWRQALALYRASGDTLQQSRMLSNLALALQQQGQPLEAQGSLEASLALLDRSDGPSGPPLLRTRAQALHTQGRLRFQTGHFQDALHSWRQAVQLSRQVGASDAELSGLINQAEALQALGNLFEARSLLETLLARPELDDLPRLKAAALSSLAATVQRQGEDSLSQSLQQRSLEAARASGDASATHAALLGLADQLASQGATAGALRDYQQAASLPTAAGVAAASAPSSARLPLLQAEAKRLALLVDTDQYGGAGRLWPQLFVEVEALPSNPASLELRLHLARTLLRLRQLGPALPTSITPPEASLVKLLQRCQLDAARLGDGRSESLANGELGALAEVSGRWGEAESLTQLALRQAIALKAPELSYRWLWQLGRLARLQGNREAALEAYQQSLHELGSLRLDLTSSSPALASSFRRSVEPISRQTIDLLTASAAPKPSDLDLARKIIEQLQVEELNDYFRQPCFQSNANDRFDDKSTAVIYPFLLPDRLEVIVRLPGPEGALLHHAQPLPEGALERTVAELERLLRKPPDASSGGEATSLLPYAQMLHQWLLAPLEPRLQASGINRLVFVPDAALRNLPMAVLHDGQRYLGERYAISLAPGMLLTPSIQRHGSRPRVLLAGLSEGISQVAGLPEGSNTFPALPAVERELANLRRRTSATLLLNERFTSQALERELQTGDYAVVHLATHGQFSSSPRHTFLLAGQHDVIPVSQLPKLLQPSQRRTGNTLDLLVLSACQGALGDADANLGLAAVAVRSGASSTLASLWSVNDQSTALFMEAFYRHWLGEGTSSRPIGKAEALRLAQADLRDSNDYRHPYYWAPFTLLGNWS
ncbi:MAG: CHAT domain-containing protein [Synechococcaceae cyanobacterium]|nr:CHAT domain-containing protein [Synechococcaceae cyanobacterium]